jgi:hypothetical protein
MIKSELSRTIKSTKGKIAIGLIFGMPFLDFLLHVYEDIVAYGDYDKLKFGLSRFLNPAYAGFLSGSSIGKFLQISFFWMLPLYFLILYSDNYITDLKYGYNVCLASRVGKKKYFKNKFEIAFLLPLVITLFSFTFNLICNAIIFHGGNNFRGYEQFYETMDSWFVWGYRNPYIYYFIYLIADAAICALSSILGLCCSILFKNYYTAYPVAFFIWLSQLILPFGAGRSIQPYTEYGLKYFIYGLVCFSAIVIVFLLLTYFIRVKNDDFS